MTVVLTGSGDLPFGVARLLGDLVFSLGLILVVVGGAELFTDDVLVVVAYASGRVLAPRLLRAWLIVYVDTRDRERSAAGFVAKIKPPPAYADRPPDPNKRGGLGR